MTSWREGANARKDYRHEAVPELEPRHQRKTKRPKDFGIASYGVWHSSIDSWRWFNRGPYYQWYETAFQRDQAFRKYCRESFRTHWRVEREDVEWVNAQ